MARFGSPRYRAAGLLLGGEAAMRYTQLPVNGLTDRYG
jgi:hypothetical protein